MDSLRLEELLGHVVEDPAKKAKMLFDAFCSLRAIEEAEIEEISNALLGDRRTAIYIKLAVSLASRRECDKLAFGKKHTESEIEKYFIAFFFGMSVETVAVMSIDALDRVVAVDKAGEGTVNFSNVMPRKILEIAKRRKAKSIVMAHNHPGGCPIPSDDDTMAAKLISELLNISGVDVLQNYVVAANKCSKVNVK